MTGAARTNPLLPPAALAEVISLANARLAHLTLHPSRYQTLAEIARIHQDCGNALSQAIYAASKDNAPAIACTFGCDACCHIPSVNPQVTTTDFTMTVIDVVSLIEHAGEAPAPGGDFQKTPGPQAVVPCPNLTAARACGIYHHRPVTCKIWFSANVTLCVRNRDDGYTAGVNPMTDESDRVRSAFEAPFAARVAEAAPDMAFSGHDFLKTFAMVEGLRRHGLIAVFRAQIDHCPPGVRPRTLGEIAAACGL